jgi:hypothetical protein
MTIWDPSYKEKDLVLEPLANEDVKLAEEAYQVLLPSEYIKVLREQNGGFLRTNAIPVNFPSFYAEGYVQLDHLLGIKKDQGIMESSYLLPEWGITDTRFIAISGEGHEWITLDYRESSTEPKITHISVHEEEPVIHTIAQSFSELLQMMVSTNLDYEDVETDPAFYEDEISVINGKKLMQTGDLDNILRGASYWLSTAENLDELLVTLLEFIKKPSGGDNMIYHITELLRSMQSYLDQDDQHKILATYKACNKNGVLDSEIEDLEKMLFT